MKIRNMRQMKIRNMCQMVQDGQVEHMERKLQAQVYYYQQEQVIHLVNKEYMIWPEMYGSGRLNIPLIQVILVLYAGAIIVAVAAILQQPTVTSALRPITASTSASGFHFIKS